MSLATAFLMGMIGWSTCFPPTALVAPPTRTLFAYNKQQYPQVPATLHTKYKRVPASLFNTTDEENEKIDLDEAKETCEMYDMAQITSRDECVRAARELGYCGNIEQYFVQRNATGHIQITPTIDIPKPIVTTEPTTWRTNVQCETCPDYLNQKITGTVLQGELFDSKDCNATTARVIRKMNVNECQRSFHDKEEEAFSWQYSCNEKGDVVEVTPYPAGVGDCTGKPTSFDQGVWKSFAEMDKAAGTKTFADTFFHTVSACGEWCFLLLFGTMKKKKSVSNDLGMFLFLLLADTTCGRIGTTL